ncbi:MAG TPA: hypothetical protein VFX61_15700 [Micromonosporaceae bacterium]|nr:hypothetical protein [Micromonosporaceae bacterium]
MTEASIDDLLGHEEEPAGDRRGAGRGGWVRSALVAAALTAVTLLGLRLFGIGVSPVVVFAGFAALLLLRRLTAQVTPPPGRTPRSRGADDGLYRFDSADGLRGEVNRWQRKLRWARKDPDRFVRVVRPALAELVDERLRQRHGCTRASDPVRAKTLLGEPLWTLLTDSRTRSPSARQYAAILAKLEEL